jgi:membrane-bound lytic murein transglycosylase D
MKTMLKSRVPFYCYSIALIIAVPTVPTAADPGHPLSALAPVTSAIPATFTGTTTLAAASPTVPAISISPATPKKEEISLPISNKQGMKFVHSYIRNNDECLHIVRQRSEGPFTIIDSVLGHYGLPLELKYLAVIESELKTSARSRVGARGPWQLMPETAHDLGLKVSRRSDDRTNYYKSTGAAAKYLRDLHREFGDWLLVLAAYNGGPRPVYKAIHKAHSRSFWVLQRYLPAESRQHVKKFIATAYYFEVTAKASPSPRPTLQTVSAPVRENNPVPAQESDNEKFERLMVESAKSLKASNELLSN